MTFCAYSYTQYGLHTQCMLLVHADNLLCLQPQTVGSPYIVHASNPCWWLVPTAAHSRVSTQYILLTHVHDLLCLQLHTVGSQFLSVALLIFPFDSSSYFGFTLRRYTVVYPMAHILNPRAGDHRTKSYWFTKFRCLQLQIYFFQRTALFLVRSK